MSIRTPARDLGGEVGFIPISGSSHRGFSAFYANTLPTPVPFLNINVQAACAAVKAGDPG